jgi:hypothetical protein
MIRNDDGFVGIWKQEVLSYSFRFYPVTRLEGLQEIMKNPSQDSWYPD